MTERTIVDLPEPPVPRMLRITISRSLSYGKNTREVFVVSGHSNLPLDHKCSACEVLEPLFTRVAFHNPLVDFRAMAPPALRPIVYGAYTQAFTLDSRPNLFVTVTLGCRSPKFT